jgi:cytochrome P450
MTLGGQAIAERDRVLLVQNGANHDAKQFPEPSRFDIGRSPNKHTAFGQGIHTCLGAPLARLEAQEAFSALAEAFPSFTISESQLEYYPTVVSRSLKRLHITFVS